MIAKVTTLLDAPAEQAWAAVKKPETLVFVARGMLAFSTERFPDRWRAGETVQTKLFFFGVVPAWKHRLEVVRVDETRLELYTNERGGAISKWNHRIRVEPQNGNRCLYVDEIEINAGLLTPFVWLFAQIFYRYRQRRLKTLLREIVKRREQDNGDAARFVG